jgi:RND superfamily putative drug exporter
MFAILTQESHSLKRFTTFIIKYSKTALFGFIGLSAILTIIGVQAMGLLQAGGYENPQSESTKVTQLLESEYGQKVPEIAAVVDFGRSVGETQSVSQARELRASMKSIEGVDKVTSYFTLGSPPALRSTDGKAAYFFIEVKKNAVASDVAGTFADNYKNGFDGLKVYLSGSAVITSEINGTISKDLAVAEAVAVPIVVILLLFVFGSLVAAGLPLLVAGLSIGSSLFFVWVSTQLNDTSVFAINLITAMGLGLGIDYALLIVNRFREERKAGHDVDTAVARTISTAGRTVLFSGLTVSIVTAAMWFFPQTFLHSLAVGGVAVVFMSVAAALIPLPALLRLLGDRVNKFKVLRGDLAPKDVGLWSNVSRFVMKRPAAILIVTVLALGGAFTLTNGVVFSQVDDRILAKTSPAVIASNQVRERFEGREGAPMEVLVEGGNTAAVTAYAQKLSKVSDVKRVQFSHGMIVDGKLDKNFAPFFSGYDKGDYRRIVVIHDVEPRSPAGYDFTVEARAVSHKGLDNVYIGGSAAVYTDAQKGIEDNLLPAVLWIVLATLVLLFLFTGSVLLPIKAVILNVISLGAVLGVLNYVFAKGSWTWLTGDFITTGTIDTSSLVLLAVIAFGLSMDYELFLLSRIKEQHEAGLSTTESVAIGLQRSGRIITAAALVLAVSFSAFAFGGVSIMKMLGVGIGLAILIDATIVRALMVPALMRLFGDLNWWAPKWMKKVYDRFGLKD